MCPLYWEPSSECSPPNVAHQCWAEENNHLPQPAGNALPEVAQETFCFKGPLLVHGQLLTSQLPHSIPRGWVCSSPGARLGASWGSCWHVSSPFKIPLNGSTSGVSASSPSFLASASLLWVHFVPPSSLFKIKWGSDFEHETNSETLTVWKQFRNWPLWNFYLSAL